jgi:hypothetical protein
MIGSATTMLFIWHSGKDASRRGPALVSLFAASTFLFTWLATHAFELIDSLYPRDSPYAFTWNRLFCQSTITYLYTTYTLDSRPDRECNFMYAGAAISIIIGIIQFLLAILAAAQVWRSSSESSAADAATVAGTPAVSGVHRLARIVGMLAAFLAFVGQVLRAGGVTRIWLRFYDNVDIVNVFVFMGTASPLTGTGMDIGPNDYAIQIQTLGMVIAVACLFHLTASQSEIAAAKKPLHNKVPLFLPCWFLCGADSNSLVVLCRYVQQ